jgi:mRNA interferase RelE/StbE
MSYTIHYVKDVVQKDIPSLDSGARELIKRTIEERLMVDPVSFGKPFRYSLKGHRRLRVSDYRIVYRIADTTVFIVAIKHRKEVYAHD